MAKVDMTLPKLGESISEATVLRFLKNVGDSVEKGEAIIEVATDKVDSEIAANETGVLTEIFVEENEVVKVGQLLAKIEIQGEAVALVEVDAPKQEKNKIASSGKSSIDVNRFDESGRFFSPLVRSMAKAEGLSFGELVNIKGSGNNSRVLKKDLEAYLSKARTASSGPSTSIGKSSYEGRVEIIEMDRMRSMIADHMVHSKHTAPHVTSYVEADVTNLVEWREKNKTAFEKKHGQKITFTPIFVEAVVEALKEFPLINVSVEGNKILVKKDIHIGLATALPNGNLIVPVIRNADQKNLLGLTDSVNDLVNKARNNKLQADEVRGSTFTISNVGTFRNIMGTPIINQPEVAILATGAIRKRAAVVETEFGDMIAIRQMMYLSLSYDHRVVDGNLGGSFLARIGDHLENFDSKRDIG